nr:autism susceptibility gene 2 protein-like isoform X2 [Onthophagus taurus]
MDAETKQRHRRRKRALRMAQAQREMAKEGDSGEDDSPVREKPQRPPNRRKKSKEPLVEEDIIDGFAILGFKSYEDLELALKIQTKENVKRLVDVERPKLDPIRPHIITHHISAHHAHGLTLQDPATSDDSGRASERLTSSSVAPRDADSSRDRLSDASSRCSSGKGYICDSEGDDDKGSDASSVIFGSAPASRKHEFPGALPPSLPLSNGTSNSPVPAPTPPDLPAPLPAPAQLPPPPPQHTAASAAVRIEEKPPPPIPQTISRAISLDKKITATAMDIQLTGAPNSPVTIGGPGVPPQQPQQQPAPAVPMLPPHDLAPTSNRSRTESPAVATSAPAYHAPYQPLYTPYSQTPYSAPVHQPPATVTAVVTTSVPTVQAVHPVHPATVVSRTASSPRGHSPTRERESYSNVSSLSRSSVATPQGTSSGIPQPQPGQPTPAATTVSSSSLSLNKVWSGAAQATQLSPAPPPRPTPPLHQSFTQPPMFAAPLPPSSSVARASPLAPTVASQPPASSAPNPNPFSAENLFQTNQADMLRRELDNRFLATQDRSLNVAPPPYLRTEMHQHQHHHTHVHQHTTSLLPPPPASTLFPSPLFKDIPKLGSVESPFYRQNMAMSNYPGYTPSLLHPGLTAGPTPFVPPNHLGPFQPKAIVPDPSKPKPTKTGKWNAMHVRIAWEIYHHQQKSGEVKSGPAKDLLRPPTHLFSPSVHPTRPHDLSSFPPSLPHRPPTYDQPPHHSSLFTSPASHIGRSTISPFTRYGTTGFSPAGASPFGVSPFAGGRDLGLQLHDPWRSLQRTVPTFPSVSALPPSLPGLPPPAPWAMKPDPLIEQREREERERQERERERLRREREERERREREEKQRRLEQQERERERREKERREQERLEREQRERERLLHQQRLESSKALNPVLRDRSPHRNGLLDHGEVVRIKEEPRSKEEELARVTDPRYHPYLRPPAHAMQPPMLDRARMLSQTLGHPYQPPTSHWPPPPPADAFYRYDHLRYNPLIDAMRAEEERAKLFGGYAPHPAQLRTKDPALMHLRGPGPPPPLAHKLCATPPTDLHKKEEPR